MKINSARTFVARRCKSFDMPRVRPVNSMTRQTPSATPATLTSVRMGRWRMFEVTRLSMCNKFPTDLLEYNLSGCGTRVIAVEVFMNHRLHRLHRGKVSNRLNL